MIINEHDQFELQPDFHLNETLFPKRSIIAYKMYIVFYLAAIFFLKEKLLIYLW